MSEWDGVPADGCPPARRAGGVGPSGYDRPRRGRHGAGGDAIDRSGSDRHAAQGYAAGRHGADERDVDDRYALEAGDHTSVRYDDPVGYEPDDIVGYEPGRHGSRYRPDEYARPRPRPRPRSHGVERYDRGYLDRGRPEYASDEFESDEYEYEYEYDSDDDLTVRLPAAEGGTGRRRSPEDGDDPAAEGPGRESPPPRARTGRSDERPTRRRRWPWVVGAVAAAAAVVPLGLAVLGGTEEPRPSSQAGSVVGLGTPSGTGQPGVAPTAAGAAPQSEPSAAGAAPQPAAAPVTYEVTGSGSAGTITFGRGTSVAQVSDAELPWKRTGPGVAEPAEYTLTAAGGSGKISCKILVDGAVLAEETADGNYAAVSCNGRR